MEAPTLMAVGFGFGLMGIRLFAGTLRWRAARIRPDSARLQRVIGRLNPV
jgi:hypothetical protein